MSMGVITPVCNQVEQFPIVACQAKYPNVTHFVNKRKQS
jgi:hypothetical protein